MEFNLGTIVFIIATSFLCKYDAKGLLTKGAIPTKPENIIWSASSVNNKIRPPIEYPGRKTGLALQSGHDSTSEMW